MSSQLNPDAKEFVPTSPVHSNPTSPLNNRQNGGSGLAVHHAYLYDDDKVIAQSPRKGTPMDNIAVPSENEFDLEISSRPAELEKQVDLIGDFQQRPGSSCSQASYQEMNLKEAMHGDEKLEYAPETDQNGGDAVDRKENIDPIIAATDELSEGFLNQTEQLGKVIGESDPMNMSFYGDNNPFDMNAVQKLPIDEFDEEENSDNNRLDKPILLEGEQGERIIIEDASFGMSDNIQSPLDEISKPEEDMYSPLTDNGIESDKPESELQLSTSTENQSNILQAVQDMAQEVTSLISSVTNPSELDSPIDVRFDAESFVENIKDSQQDKYVEGGLSPTLLQPESEFTKESFNEDSPESDSCLIPSQQQEQQQEILSTLSMEPQDGSYNTTPVIHDDFTSEPSIDTKLSQLYLNTSAEAPSDILESETKTETPPPTPATAEISPPELHDVTSLMDALKVEEPEKATAPVEEIEIPIATPVEEPLLSYSAPVTEQEVPAPIVVEEPTPAPIVVEEPTPAPVESESLGIAAVAAVAVAATVGATAATVAATKKPATPKGKVADVKKPEVSKSRTSASAASPKPASSLTARKPLVSATTSKTSTSSATTKTTLNKTATSTTTAATARPKPTTTTLLSARPKTTVAASPTKPASTIEKKTTTTSSVGPIRKPSTLTNGVSAIKKTSTTTTTAASPTSKPSPTATKASPARPASARTSTLAPRTSTLSSTSAAPKTSTLSAKPGPAARYEFFC